MNRFLIAFVGAGVGAGTMYLFDPDGGRRRRARAREAATHVSHVANEMTGTTARDVHHRLSGLAARTLDRLIDESPSAPQCAGPQTVAAPLEKWFRWTPTARLIAGIAGLALVALSSPNRPIRGAGTGVAGIELVEGALLGKP